MVSGDIGCSGVPVAPWSNGPVETIEQAREHVDAVAGDNVVRFLPPLIVTEAEIEDSVQRLERACVKLSGSELKRAAGQ